MLETIVNAARFGARSTAKTIIGGMLLAGIACGSGNSGNLGSRLGESCYGNDSNCGYDEICEGGICISEEEAKPTVGEPLVLDGVSISQGKTNSLGKAYFLEGSEEVITTILDEQGHPVTDATVTYFDARNKNSECFQAVHSSYVPVQICFAHNSEHAISLTPNPLQPLHHDRSGNERNRQALDHYVQWQKSVGRFMGCRNEDQLAAMLEGGLLIYKGGAAFFSLGITNNTIDQVGDFMKEYMEGNVGDVTLFIPSQERLPNGKRMIGTATIWTLEMHPRTREILGDGVDNNCDGQIDNGSIADEPVEDEPVEEDCNPHPYRRFCIGTATYRVEDACGELIEEHGCDADEICDEGYCVEDTPICTPHYTTACEENRVVERDGCGYSETVETCSADERCEDSECIEKVILSGRFVDLGDGTVRDTDYGWIWQREAPGSRNHSEATAYCNTLSLGGSSSWRLPNSNELVRSREGDSGCRLSPIFNGPCGYYWTNESCGGGGSSGSWSDRVQVSYTTGQSSNCLSMSSSLEFRCIKE